MVYSEKVKICVSGASELDPCCPRIKELSKDLGKAIAYKAGILLTGATTGVPYYAAKGFKEVGGFSIGFSPAGSRKEHEKVYKLPTDKFDLIVYTGFDYVGRNLILTKSADGVIVGCGRTGTLNEFTIAFETKTPIGVLQGTGGTADFIEDLLKGGYRPLTKMIYSKKPKDLVEKMVGHILEEKQNNKES